MDQVDIVAWIILPLLIFTARICDVSLGTIRVIFVARGYRYLAPILGFFEISIWLLAIGQIMRDLDNIVTYFAYAGGFASGLTQPLITNTTTSGQVSAEILQEAGQFNGTTVGTLIDLLPVLFVIVIIAGTVGAIALSKKQN